MKKRTYIRIRVSEDLKADLELASKMTDISMSEIVRDFVEKGTKKILRDIEKGK